MLIRVLNIGEEKIAFAGKGKWSKFDVTYKNEATGKTNGKTLVSFNFPEVYSHFKQSVPNDLASVTTEKNEKGFLEWVKVERGVQMESTWHPESETGVAKKVDSNRFETPEERAHRQVLIVRQSSISSAIDFLVSTATTNKATIKNVIDTAETIESWVFRDTQKKDAMKEIIGMKSDVIT